MASQPPRSTGGPRALAALSATVDAACVAFLQWALPHIGLQWAGFRRVRRQVCRRLARRLGDLEIADLEEYRQHLVSHPQEWQALARLCRITISRCLRDRGVFSFLAKAVLPGLAAGAQERGQHRLRAWCAGCASGEEVWSLRLVWDLEVAPGHTGVSLNVLGTDVDLAVLARARRAVYPPSSLREVPGAWRLDAFEPLRSEMRLRDRFRHGVELAQHDLRSGGPGATFDLILCRNLAFTYFSEVQQWQTAKRLAAALRPGGALFLGSHERLRQHPPGIVTVDGPRGLYRRLE